MKKFFTLLFILLSFFAQADYWTQKADFGGPSRGEAVGFSIGNKGYIGTGVFEIFGVPIYSDFWEYNTVTNTWTQKADFGGGMRFMAVGFSINNKGYLGTGHSSSAFFLNDFWEYDPVTNTWTQKANLAGVGRYGATGFSINDKGYIGTGVDSAGNNLKDFWEYDPLANTWTQKANLTGAGRHFPVGFSNGIKGYIGVGGFNGTIGFPDFWEWNPGTNVWTQKANYGGTGVVEASGFWLCPYGYLGIGTTYIGSGTVSDIWKYNPANNTWTPAAGFGAGQREMAVAFSIGNKGYAGTGWINDDSSKVDFWQYTPDSACATGIEEEFSSASGGLQFSISPNPAKDYTVISYPLAGQENTGITITNAEGKKVYETKLLTSDFRLPTSDFKKGIYFVELTNGKQKTVKKFVKE